MTPNSTLVALARRPGWVVNCFRLRKIFRFCGSPWSVLIVSNVLGFLSSHSSSAMALDCIDLCPHKGFPSQKSLSTHQRFCKHVRAREEALCAPPHVDALPELLELARPSKRQRMHAPGSSDNLVCTLSFKLLALELIFVHLGSQSPSGKFPDID